MRTNQIMGLSEKAIAYLREEGQKDINSSLASSIS